MLGLSNRSLLNKNELAGNNMNYLIGIIVALVGAFLYQRNKTNTAEARNDNLTTKEQLNDINKDISKNEGSLESEEQKQEAIKKELENNKNVTEAISSVIDFFNKRK